MLWLYALADRAAAASAPPAVGACGEPVEAIVAAGLTVFAGAPATPPPADREHLGRHDATVRALAAACDPLLPVRFGQRAADRAALAALLAPRHDALAAALARVAGCCQMTLRLVGAAAAGADAPPDDAASGEGPGTRYLAALRARRMAPEAALAPLRAAVAPLVRAERVEVPAAGPVLATAFHLIGRGGEQDYARRLAAAAGVPAGLRAVWSGPFPPWAFAAEGP